MPIVKLESSDGRTFEVDAEVIKCSGTIKTMLDDCGFDDDDGSPIPLPNVHSDTLERVLRYAHHHKNDATQASTLPKDFITYWDEQFLDVDRGRLFELILAANYLDISSLFSTACRIAESLMKGKSAKELRVFFNENCTPASDDEQK